MSILGNYITKAPKNQINQISETLNNTKDIEYILKFNNNRSLFYKYNKMKNDNEKRKRNLTEIKAGNGVFFTDKGNHKILHQKVSFDKQFLITYPKVKWKITNEKKMIGKHLCYKATAIKTIENRRGVKKIPVEAWFSPKINYNYGPKNYSGLPGLIIKLKEGSLTFSIRKITISKKLKDQKKGSK